MFSLIRKLFRNQVSLSVQRFKLIEKAELAHVSGDYRKAIKHFTKLIEDRTLPSPTEDQLWAWYLNRGLALRAIGYRHEALRDYQQAANLNPASHKPHLNAGIILGQDLDRHEEALAELNKALELNPQDIDTLSALGTTEMALDNIIAAESHYRAAQSIQPNDADVIYNLGNLYFFHKDQPREAVKFYQQATKLKPNDFDIRNNLNIALDRIRTIEKQGHYIKYTCSGCRLIFFPREAGATEVMIFCPGCRRPNVEVRQVRVQDDRRG